MNPKKNSWCILKTALQSDVTGVQTTFASRGWGIKPFRLLDKTMKVN